MADLRQSREYAEWMKSLGWAVDKGMFIKKLPLGINFIKWQRPKSINVINQKAFLIKIEPDALRGNKKIEKELKALGFKKDRSPMLPTKTIIIDLSKSEIQLLKEMHSKTRYNVKKHGQKIEIIRGDEISDKQLVEFFRIYKQNTSKQKFWGLNYKQLNDLFKCFSRKVYLLRSDEGGLVLLVHDGVAYYSHNGVNKKGRQKYLPTLLTFEAIRLAKKMGCQCFDFEGIEDERFLVTKKWRGFSRFKKSFGGKEVEYLGSFSKFFN